MQRNAFDKIPLELLIVEILPKLTSAELSSFLSTNKKYYQLSPHYSSMWSDTAKTKFQNKYNYIPTELAHNPNKQQLAILFNQMEKSEAEKAAKGCDNVYSDLITVNSVLCAFGMLSFGGGCLGFLALSNPEANHEIGGPASLAALSLGLLLCVGSCVYQCYQSAQATKKQKNITILEKVVVAESDEIFMSEATPLFNLARKA